jgi:hypothetical protein
VALATATFEIARGVPPPDELPWTRPEQPLRKRTAIIKVEERKVAEGRRSKIATKFGKPLMIFLGLSIKCCSCPEGGRRLPSKFRKFSPTQDEFRAERK